MKLQQNNLTRLLGGKYSLYLFGTGLFLLFLLIFFFNPIARTLKILSVMLVFILINVFIKKSLRAFTSLPLEIEVATFGSVVVTTLFGVRAGILTAVLATFAAAHFSRGITLYTPMMASGYIIAALLALLFSPANIVAGGIIITFIVNAYFIFIFQLVGYSFLENFLYSISNVVLNTLLFIKVAPLLINVLS